MPLGSYPEVAHDTTEDTDIAHNRVQIEHWRPASPLAWHSRVTFTMQK